MYSYQVMDGDIANGDGEKKAFSQMSEIARELMQLKEQQGYTLGFTSTPIIDNVEELGILNSSYYKGIFVKTYIQSYYCEINFLYPDNTRRLYGYITGDFDEVNDIIYNFVVKQKIPDYSNWQ